MFTQSHLQSHSKAYRHSIFRHGAAFLHETEQESVLASPAFAIQGGGESKSQQVISPDKPIRSGIIDVTETIITTQF